MRLVGTGTASHDEGGKGDVCAMLRAAKPALPEARGPVLRTSLPRLVVEALVRLESCTRVNLYEFLGFLHFTLMVFIYELVFRMFVINT